VQDAFTRAVERWPRDGIPHNPGAWITTTARNSALDRIRRDANYADKLRDLEAITPPASVSDPLPTEREAVADDRLRLIFTCCHPALAPEARVALTLKTLGGLTTPEVARAFLTSTEGMTQRLVRAKRKIRVANIPYVVPEEHDLPDRLQSVLATLYSIYNEGYLATSGDDLTRIDLSSEAIRLARVLGDLMPDEGEVAALLALMLLHDSRRDARTDEHGQLVTLEHQDRSKWNREEIVEGITHARRALAMAHTHGSWSIEAAIAVEHAIAGTTGETDWETIAYLYDALRTIHPSPIVDLNRAVAIAFARGYEEGLAEMDAIAARGDLAGYHLLPAARADLLRRLGRASEAEAAYREAVALTGNDAERDYLMRRIEELLA
jgi:RNA polymerase sigma-70 factor (ECF subfamily)